MARRKAEEGADEPEKKQEIRGIDRKKSRGRSGRIREKAGNQGHWPEGKPEKKRTNQRKSKKSGALARRKAEEEADEPEKKQEIRGIDQKKSRRRSGRIGEKARNREHRSAKLMNHAPKHIISYKSVIFTHQNPYNYVIRL